MFSDYGDIEARVPYDSILGHLLVLIHISDIIDNIQSGIMLLADNTSLFITIANNDIEATEQLNNDLQRVNEWDKKWLVSFNPQKNKPLHVTLKKTANTLPLLFDGQALEYEASQKHLGLVLNNKLIWIDHIDNVSTGANKKLNCLPHRTHLLDRKTLHIMYESFIRPSLEYGDLIYCNCIKLEIDSLESKELQELYLVTQQAPL